MKAALVVRVYVYACVRMRVYARVIVGMYAECLCMRARVCDRGGVGIPVYIYVCRSTMYVWVCAYLIRNM